MVLNRWRMYMEKNKLPLAEISLTEVVVALLRECARSNGSEAVNPALDAGALHFVAQLLLRAKPFDRARILPAFNDCAKRIGWGKLPEPAVVSEGEVPRSAEDVFKPYREAGLITWPQKGWL